MTIAYILLKLEKKSKAALKEMRPLLEERIAIFSVILVPVGQILQILGKQQQSENEKFLHRKILSEGIF
ncbi:MULTISPECIES: hypothetical protein [Nostocales]|uniref:Uncharacterized protein n=3 Tax=Nostocales TaxID=1161 RepID=A0A8S9SYP6_9CYAN|nr:hypothetical protein [Tolypothrix bouteillei]KAF3885471.1 hypothetical protein DA73_0400008380 [Tolypothrix bouteillei VB521301]